MQGEPCGLVPLTAVFVFAFNSATPFDPRSERGKTATSLLALIDQSSAEYQQQQKNKPVDQATIQGFMGSDLIDQLKQLVTR